ncbi:hypothetical protein M758_12G094100 [Ceratodon purpureus]|nr:hypothetical protein M758_12G094100 [Ceratodon purpureus]
MLRDVHIHAHSGVPDSPCPVSHCCKQKLRDPRIPCVGLQIQRLPPSMQALRCLQGDHPERATMHVPSEGAPLLTLHVWVPPYLKPLHQILSPYNAHSNYRRRFTKKMISNYKIVTVTNIT